MALDLALKVIFRASFELKRLMTETPRGRLPLLPGRYKTWEEVIATFCQLRVSRYMITMMMMNC